MRLRVCSLLLLFMALSIDADKAPEIPAVKPSMPATQQHEKEKMQGTEEEKKTVPADEPNAPAMQQGEEEKIQDNLPPPKAMVPMNVFIYNPWIGYYHTKFMATIANQLHAAGHSVTMLDSLIDTKFTAAKRNSGITTLEVKQNSKTAKIVLDGDTMDTGLEAFWDDLSFKSEVLGFLSFYKRKSGFSPMMSYQCEDVLKSDNFTKIKEVKFDLAITEVFDFCGVGMFHLLKPARTMLASSVPLHEHLGEKLGLPKTFDVVPTKFSISTAANYRDGFEEFSSRGFIENAIASAIFGQEMFEYLAIEQTKIFKKLYGTDFPDFKKLLRGAHSLLENVHPLLDLSKPTLNSIIPIGGITVQSSLTVHTEQEAEQLKKIMAEIYDAKAEKNSIVLVSFGTVMTPKSMKKETKQNLIKAFENVTTATFFWAVKTTELVTDGITIPSNVKIYDWLPQKDLLASGTIDLFVSHMGIGSMTEAAYSGVPLVAVPLFVDQHYNYICARRLGIALHVDKATLSSSSNSLSEAIGKALGDKNLKENSTLLKDRLNSFGNQTTKMMEHINFTLSLPANSVSMAFHNHHHEFKFQLSIRSLVHLIPYYAMSIGCFVLAVLLILALGYFKGPRREELPLSRVLQLSSYCYGPCILFIFVISRFFRFVPEYILPTVLDYLGEIFVTIIVTIIVIVLIDLMTSRKILRFVARLLSTIVARCPQEIYPVYVFTGINAFVFLLIVFLMLIVFVTSQLPTFYMSDEW